VLAVAIVASAPAYQRAASWAAATFAIHARSPDSVSVLVPQQEPICVCLQRRSRHFGFSVERFPLTARRPANFTGWLKCQAFVWKLRRISDSDVVLFADADTACLKAIRLPSLTKREISTGQIGLVADIADHHCRTHGVPCYLRPKERQTYVNTGVLFAAKRSIRFFELVLSLAKRPGFLDGPFQEQKIINFALGRHYPSHLTVLDKKFNAMRIVDARTVIAHFAGGAGRLETQPRRHRHVRFCSEILEAGYEAE
jgi:hypothetical protein